MQSRSVPSYTLVKIAETGARFSDFAPFVPSINDNGRIAFQAALHSGASGVFAGAGAAIHTIADPIEGQFSHIRSHPDINNSNQVCFFAELRSGQSGVFLIEDRAIKLLSPSHGPLGPTLNNKGDIAFRSTGKSANAAIFARRDGANELLAETGSVFQGFHGLPVINQAGTVVFRADMSTGGHAIFEANDTDCRSIVQLESEFQSLGGFPISNDAGEIGFCATLHDGHSGIFAARNGSVELLIDSRSGYESFRGVLINNSGLVAFYATPFGGSLGIFAGPDPVRNHLLSIGSPLFGSTVSEFALNPVSLNEAGQLAIRVRLTDQRQFILRADGL